MNNGVGAIKLIVLILLMTVVNGSLLIERESLYYLGGLERSCAKLALLARSPHQAWIRLIQFRCQLAP